MKINPNIYPKGGYTFRDSDNSVHSGDSWAGVIRRVKKYRQRQGLPSDRVEEEVISQACQKNPGLCYQDSPERKQKLKTASLKGRVLKWLSGMRDAKARGEVSFVELPLRDARADVCSRCLLDKSLPSGCSSCQAALKELHTAVVDQRRGDARFSACPVLAEYLPVSVWIESQAIVNPELPPECWRKRSV